jgi:D-alanyl-D-alanine carboxypeptidase
MTPSRIAGLVLSCSIALLTSQTHASAGPSLVVDVGTGRVLEQEDATRPWYPASLTKLLTVYIALTDVRDGKVSLDTPFVVSKLAASMPPSNMGFKPGTEVTLDNILKMMMVHSANDLAVVIAEGLSGSVPDFAAEMNRMAAQLGLSDSHFDNPNGLPDTNHWSSARDLAIVARALYRDFPQYDWLYDIGAVKLGSRVIPTHNNIMGRYPDINGMKTGFTCAAGFNVVASANRGGRQLIVVVLGSPTVKARTMKAGELLDAGYEGLFKEGPTLESLPKSSYTRPPDIHALTCAPHRPRVASDEMPPIPPASDAAPGALPPAADQMYAVRPQHFDPMPVFVGPKPGWNGPIAQAMDSPAPLPLSDYASLNDASAPPIHQQLPLRRVRRRVRRAAIHTKSDSADSNASVKDKEVSKRASRSRRTRERAVAHVRPKPSKTKSETVKSSGTEPTSTTAKKSDD